MGSGRFDSHSYHSFSSSTVGRSTEDIFVSRGIKKELNPHGVKFRESCDSADNPNATAIIVALDVTGSMGILADAIARSGLGVLFQKLLDEKPIPDPHLMFMGIGDAHHDDAPLQVSQFEADNRIVEQLTGLYLEHGGGGNNSESYHLPWYFAANHTVIDCWAKRGKKGYLFTVGDECVPDPLTASQIHRIIGDTPEQNFTAQQLLLAAQEKYHVFHIIIEQGNYAKSYLRQTTESWTKLLGQRALGLKDYTKLAEGVYAIIEMNEASFGHTKSSAPKELPGYMALLSAAD